ncbi:3'-5'-exoribonuclease [Microbotryomycetes sp. JL201]|nr:3'-5'-exoribonuclease [Microbotryomycetes sp. JL201]
MQAADRRRYNAPEGSTPLLFASPDLAPQPPNLETGLVTEAAGSAYIEAGRTKLVCAVYGPKPTPPSAPFSPKARLNVEIKFAPFSSGVRRFVPGKDTEAAGLSTVLQQSLLPAIRLDLLPKSQIDLFVTVLESDGSDADISLSASMSPPRIVLSFAPETFAPLLDPTRDEVKGAAALASFSCMPALGTVTNCHLTGIVPVTVYEQTLTQMLEVCGQIHTVVRDVLARKATHRDN